MTVHAVTMPKWGMTMTEGKVVGWLAREGDRVEAGQELFEVETEKIANVVEAQASGVLRRVLVREGEAAACGAPVALIADEGATDAELDAVAAEAARAEEAGGGLASRTVEAGALRLNVVSAGAGEPPLVLLHGFASDAGAWMFVQEELARGRAVHAVDLPSHGGSDVDASLASLDALAGALRPAIDALAPGALHLAGHSLGGRLALRLARDLGDRVRSLVLLAPAGLGGEGGEDFPSAFLAADRRRAMKDAMRTLVADEGAVTSEMVERGLAARRIDGAVEALSAIREASLGERAREGAAEEMAALSAPVLLLWGAEDRVIPPPGGGETQVAGAGHLPQMERAAEVARLMAAHLEANP